MSTSQEIATPGADALVDRMAGEPSGLWTASFLGLLATQFLGALNDNMFRWLVVPIAKDLVSAPGDEAGAALSLSVGLACFVLPYLLFAAPAGFLADRYSKRTVIVGCKIAEVVLMLLGAAVVWLNEPYLMFAVLFLMGTQSALFGPSKLGILPELLPPRALSAANGLMGLTTILAVVAGTAAGSLLFVATADSHLLRVGASGAALAGVAAVGYVTSLAIARVPAGNPARRFPKRIFTSAAADLAMLARHAGLFRVALGIAFFWSVASLAQLNVDALVVEEFGKPQTAVAAALAVLSIGVGVGSVLAGWLSAGKVELGLVPIGAAAVAAGSLLLNAVSEGYLVWLFLLGVGGGVFNVPLAAYIQDRSPPESRGAILAAGNFLSFAGMLAMSAAFYVLHGAMGLDATSIFFITGVATLPVLLYVLILLPWATARLVVWLAAHTVYRVRIEGGDRAPRRGGALLVANHVTWLDGLFLMISSSRSMRLLVDDTYLKRRWLRALARVAQAIPFTPPLAEDERARRSLASALTGGQLVGVFAEGQVTRSGELQPFRHDVAALAREAGVPVVPVYLDELWGSVFSYERGRVLWKWPRRLPYRVTIRFGEPILAENMDEVRAAVAALAKPAAPGLTTEDTEGTEEIREERVEGG